MAILPQDLIAPRGELMPEMFPEFGDFFQATVEEWITQAETAAAAYDPEVYDRAVRAWVYGRAYRTIARRMALEPDSASAEGISQSIGANRIQYFESLAAQHEAEFLRLELVPGLAPRRNVGTRSVKTQVHF